MIVLEEKGLWKGIPNKLLEFSKKRGIMGMMF